ncbi:MAG: hypothetical protein ABJA82_02925, partial [Myxococcales bacterium]
QVAPAFDPVSDGIRRTDTKENNLGGVPLAGGVPLQLAAGVTTGRGEAIRPSSPLRTRVPQERDIALRIKRKVLHPLTSALDPHPVASSRSQRFTPTHQKISKRLSISPFANRSRSTFRIQINLTLQFAIRSGGVQPIDGDREDRWS